VVYKLHLCVCVTIAMVICVDENENTYIGTHAFGSSNISSSDVSFLTLKTIPKKKEQRESSEKVRERESKERQRKNREREREKERARERDNKVEGHTETRAGMYREPRQQRY